MRDIDRLCNVMMIFSNPRQDNQQGLNVKSSDQLQLESLYTQPNYYKSYREVANPCATHDEVPMGYHQLLCAVKVTL